jgi:hypothetical protein
MQQINLYQEQFRTRRDPLGARTLAAALAALVLVLVGVSVWLQLSAADTAERLQEAEQRRDRVEQQVLAVSARLEALADEDAAAASEPARLRAELVAKQRLMEYLEDGPLARRDGFSEHLDGLAQRVVADLWFDRIVLERGGDRLRFEGHALRAADVPTMIAALGQEDVFAGHAFRSLVIERPEDAEWRVDFMLSSDRVEAVAGRDKGAAR